MIYAHTLTFSELVASKIAVVTPQGELIAGPDRRHEPEGAKWKAWQKSIGFIFSDSNRFKEIPPHVMEYFQNTKHLSKPPAAGDMGLHTKTPLEVIEEGIHDPKPIPEEAIIITPAKKLSNPPRFTWSYTSMQEFLTCPAQWAAKRYYKTIKEVESEAMRWGNRVHETAEHYLKKGIGQPHKENLIHPDCLPLVKRYCDALLASGAELAVEKEMCFDSRFNPCGWRDWNTVWVRSKADVLAKRDDKLSLIDYKTGRVKEDFLQLKLFAVFSALTPGYESIQEFDPKFIFLKEEDPAKAILKLPEPIKRSELKGILATEILPVVRQMEECWRTETFVEKKNGLCRKWCANTDCTHCGG